MPEKPSVLRSSFDWFGVAKSAILVVAGITVLWLNSNYASVTDLNIVQKQIDQVEVKTQVLDQKMQSIVELINTKLEYIKRDTDEIKKKLEPSK
jgi:hypothetical protein